MVLERICAGNVFSSAQKRFRNMTLPNPLATQVRYYYRLETLWSYSVPLLNNKAVVSASWCEDNSDLLAIGYGTYYFQSKSKDSKGYVCIWSIKVSIYFYCSLNFIFNTICSFTLTFLRIR